MKLKLSHCTVVLAGFSIPFFGCEKPRQEPAPVISHFELKGGGTVEVTAPKDGIANNRNGALVIQTGSSVTLSGAVAVSCESAERVKLVMLRKVEKGKESQFASAAADNWTCADGKGKFQVRLGLGKIAPTKDCRLVIMSYDGTQWKEIDELENVEVVKQ